MFCSLCYAVRYKTSEDLREAVEGEPDPGSRTLLLSSVPLARDQSESWGDCSLANAEHEADGYSTSKVLDRSKTGKHRTPGYDASRRVFANR